MDLTLCVCNYIPHYKKSRGGLTDAGKERTRRRKKAGAWSVNTTKVNAVHERKHLSETYHYTNKVITEKRVEAEVGYLKSNMKQLSGI